MPATSKKSWLNHYFALRHAESTANAQGIILAQPANGTTGYGLTENGQEQIKALDHRVYSSIGLDPSKTICYSSDFKRAFETADIFCMKLNLNDPTVDIRLRERDFGELEFESNKRYKEVWAFDKNSMDHNEFGCESLQSVSDRIRALLLDLESKFKDKQIVLCSHGDTLQITQCIFAGVMPTGHRSLPHLGNAELRLLNP